MGSGLGRVDVTESDGKYVLTFPGEKPLRPVAGIMTEFADRLPWLDRQGMVQQMLAPWLDIHGQQLPAPAGQEWVRELNNAMAEAVVPSRGRLLAHAALHLADPAAAARELERTVTQLGLTGCMLPTSFPGGHIAEPRFEPLWEAAEAIGIPLVLHPPTDGPTDPIFGDMPKMRVLGRPFETTITAGQLIVSGVLDRYPRLKIVLVHGGGFLPYQADRLNSGTRNSGGTPPSEYVRRFFYDTVLMSPQSLQLLLDVAGAEQIMIGSDYAATPTATGEWPLKGSLDQMDLAPAVRSKIVHDNASAMFKTEGGRAGG
jgi:aminocarboxymuconate-semialdehyde decarboxylase